MFCRGWGVKEASNEELPQVGSSRIELICFLPLWNKFKNLTLTLMQLENLKKSSKVI